LPFRSNQRVNCIRVDDDCVISGNLIIRNSVRGNTTNYNIGVSNRCGAIIDDTASGAAAVNGNGAASTAGTSAP
jgi:hypothetical protein